MWGIVSGAILRLHNRRGTDLRTVAELLKQFKDRRGDQRLGCMRRAAEFGDTDCQQRAEASMLGDLTPMLGELMRDLAQGSSQPSGLLRDPEEIYAATYDLEPGELAPEAGVEVKVHCPEADRLGIDIGQEPYPDDPRGACDHPESGPEGAILPNDPP